MTIRRGRTSICDCPQLITEPSLAHVPHSWYETEASAPRNPLDLIAYTSLNGSVGSFIFSNTYTNPGGTWIANPFTVTSAPVCSALGSDNHQKVADADQWNFNHKTVNTASDIAPPLHKILFLRGGVEWLMTFQIDLGISSYNDLQLGFRDNAGTRGDYAGTIPAISFSGTHTGIVTVELVLKKFEEVSMGLRAISTGGDWSMYESQWRIVP